MTTRHEFVHNGSAYALSFDWGRDDFIQAGALGIVIEASVVRPGREPVVASLAVNVTPDEEGALWFSVTLQPGDVALARLPVSELLGGENAVTRILDRIPVQAIDPVLGCALRGGLSAVIDQLIGCWGDRPDKAFGFETAWSVLACIRDNGGKVGLKASARFLKCVSIDLFES